MHSFARLAMAASFAAMMMSSACAADVKPFTFVQLSDPHLPANYEGLTAAFEDIKKNVPEAEFIVLTGDLSEFGYADELSSVTEAMKLSPVKIYSLPGNHDTRWSDNGKESFRKLVGPSYQKFEHNGVTFILMDVAMLLEQYAHFDGQQLEQLKKDLAALPEGAPAVVAMHHPPLMGFFDNDQVFTGIIRNYNVPLVMDGHGHGLTRIERDGTAYAMGGSTYGPARSYRIYHVNPDSIELLTRSFGKKVETTADTTISLVKKPSAIGELTQVPVKTNPAKFTFKLDSKPGADIKCSTYTLDRVLTGTAASLKEGLYEVDAKSLCPGRHMMVVEAGDSKGDISMRTLFFDSNTSGGPAISREFKLGSGVQSHPAVVGDVLYVGADDKKVRAFDLNNGEMMWERDLGSEILSAPTITTGSLVVGSMNQSVYNLDPKDGHTIWEFQTSGSILASPRIEDGTVFVGSGDHNMYAIDLATGKEKWRFEAGMHIKATPAYAAGKLFFGAWDGQFYCLDAATGKLVWKVPISVSGGFSAATCNPLAVDGKIIVVTHDYSTRCLDQKSGAHLWMYKPAKDELGPSYSSPVVRGRVAYLGSIAGRVLGFNIDTGEKVLDLNVRPEKTDELFDSIPLIDGNKLYVGSVGGNLYCVDLDKGQVAWKVALQPGFIFTRPVKWRDHILVGSMGDRVFDITPGVDNAQNSPMQTKNSTPAKTNRKGRRSRGTTVPSST